MNSVDLLLKLISFKTPTPQDDGSFEFLEGYLDGYEALYYNQNGVKNIFLTKKFSDSSMHLCFAGHIDVVPAGDGWGTSPFVPMIKDGFIYGRGAQDMKGGVAAFVGAVRNTKDFDGRLSILLTSDEEGDAIYGTKIILEHLKNINLMPTHCVVAEPTCESVFGDAIKVGRRGSINGILELKGKQGHAAYPEKAINPIHQISHILAQIAGVDLDGGDEYFSPSKLVITDIRSGYEVTNVTPNSLKLMFNVRNSTKTSLEDIKIFIESKFVGMDFDLKLSQSANPFVTNGNGLLVTKLSSAIEKYCGILPKLSTAGGTSDARFIATYGVEVVEFGVINDTIHAPNERVGIDEIEKLYSVFRELIDTIGDKK
jgi:succinyl-diaminopimelate desuccinylase